jgi:L-lactate utilization protein LutB
MGIEKLVPTWRDLEVFLQLLPRSSTGERMNPYTSMWTGVTPGDGPQEFHLVLFDNGRTATNLLSTLAAAEMPSDPTVAVSFAALTNDLLDALGL